MVAMENCYQFPSNKISVEQLSSLQPLNCRDLNGQHSEQGVNVVEFSDDGSLFVSGGDDDGRVLLWPTNKAIDLKWKPQATEMEIKHEDYIWYLALSTDNMRIFSGCRDSKVLIHNAEIVSKTFLSSQGRMGISL